MHRLVALSILLAAATAHAQPAGPYAPYRPWYPPQGPIYIPEPGHPADEAPDAGQGVSPPEPGYGQPAPTQPYGAPQADLPPPADAPEPGYAVQPAYAAPRTAPRALAQQLLAPQNAVRATIGERPMTWSDRLADAARQWADHLIATGQFAHRVGDPYGENLYEMTGGVASPRQVVSAWADEARNYDVRANTCSGVCGHYTQIVWRATRAVGCAVAGDANRQVWVCEYDPAGNWVGYRPF